MKIKGFDKDLNTGHCNTGDLNTGYCNTGYCNTGDRNTGDWNTCSGSNGVFCTEEDRNIRIFNVPSGMSLSEFRNSEYYDALTSSPLFINGMGSIHSSGNGHRRKEIEGRVFKTTYVQRSLFTVVGEDVAREPGNCSANSEF